MEIYGYVWFMDLRNHFQGTLEHAMVPKVGRMAIDVVQNIKKAEEEAFKHAKGACEYYARVALKVFEILKDVRGTFDYTYHWQSFVPASTRNGYAIPLFNYLRLADSTHRVTNEEELEMDLRLASSILCW